MITALLLSAFTATSPANITEDGWLAWHGCWRAQGDPTATLLCVVPANEGARLLTFNGGTLQSESRIIADGVARPVEKEGCRGTEMARWSTDQQRLFITSKMTCGEKVERHLSGIMSMYSASEWLDVQSVTTGNKTFARTTHYMSAFSPGLPAEVTKALEANKLARETARYAASSLVDLSDVVEATKSVDDHAVAEWLTMFKQQFDLNGKRLLALADAGVSETVIDVLVAVSNPHLFAVHTRDTDDRRDRERGRVLSSSCYDEFYNPWAGPMSYSYGYARCYDRYYGYNRGYSSWGYSPWQWYAVNNPVVVVRSNSNPDARVTRNGYTRDKNDTATPSSSSTERTKSTPSSSDNSSSSGSSSSSSSGSTRTAKPRDQ